MDALDTGFEPTRPEQAPELMGGYDQMWWVSGGWALDLVAGQQTRPHIDLDIGVFRGNVPDLFDALAGLELHAAGGGRLAEMSRPGDLPPESNSIWARRAGAEQWLFELILNEREGHEWVYRRDTRIRMDVAHLTVAVDGLSCVKPEIQLLFKAKHLRDRDEADFTFHAPRLHPSAAAWLHDALEMAHPGHPWTDRLLGPRQ